MPTKFYSLKINKEDNKYDVVEVDNFKVDKKDEISLYLSDFLYEATKQLLMEKCIAKESNKDIAKNFINKISILEKMICRAELENKNINNNLFETKTLFNEIADFLNG